MKMTVKEIENPAMVRRPHSAYQLAFIDLYAKSDASKLRLYGVIANTVYFQIFHSEMDVKIVESFGGSSRE